MASSHSEGLSHDCGRATRFWSRWLACRFTSPEVGVIWFSALARVTTTWAHASAPRWGETWVRSIKIPWFLAVLGETGILPKAALAVPGGPWVWSFRAL